MEGEGVEGRFKFHPSTTLGSSPEIFVFAALCALAVGLD